MRTSIAAFSVFVLALLTPTRSDAIFHIAHISEVMSGITADPNVGFVEIRMDFAFQNAVGNTRLTAFSCDGAFVMLLTLPPPTGPGGSVPNQGTGRHWLMGTASLPALTTPPVVPDFTFAGGIPKTCGQVCWGAPVDPTSGFAKDPATWDPAIPDNYVDCAAYGPYTGPQRTGAASPATATPGDGVHSLNRTTIASNDFALDCPTPSNNGPQGGAEVMGTLGTCTTPPTSTTTTSTTTTTTTSTTTTTLPTTTTTTVTTTTVTMTTTSTVPTTTTTTIPTTTTTTTTVTSTTTTSTIVTTTSTSTTTSTTTPTTTSTSTTATSTTTTTTSVTTTTVPNVPPDCSAAVATPAELWPPNHQLVAVSVVGVTDGDRNPPTVTITGVTQDEPVGATCPDATGVGTSSVKLRSERLGNGDGRVYHVAFTASDGRGGRCSGTVTVCVPHDQGHGRACGDQGALVDSTGPCVGVCGDVCADIDPTLAAPACADERIPVPVKRRLERARRLLRRATTARDERKAKSLIARMLKQLTTSAALAGAARENGTLSPTCGAELERLFRDVESQAAQRR